MNFKRYVEASDTWVDSHYIMGTSTDTITTPADIYANDTTATVGLKGNMNQNGTPTSTTPIQPQECGERTGNLLQIPDAAETTRNGVTYHVRGNSLYINGTSTSAFGFNIRNAFTLKAGTYTNQMYGFTGRRIYYSFNNINTTMCTSDVNLFKTFTISEDTTYANALVWINNGVVFDNEKIDFALFESDTPKDFDVYGYKIPISSANTTTNIYLGEVESTRKIRKYEFTGQENWSYTSTGRVYMTMTNQMRFISPICTHYKGVAVTGYAALNDGEITVSINNQLTVYDTARPTAEDFKAYLAQQYTNGTPVTVWYVLATETTGIVNEPLRKIGNYADEVSGITIPTIAGANTISVDTTLQPSEVTVNYKGWHPVADVHKRESGAWT